MRTLLSVCALLLMPLAACGKGSEEKAHEASKTVEQSSSTPTCDKLAKVLEECVAKLEDPGHAPLLKDSLELNKAAWKENPDKKRLESSCKQAFDNAKRDVAAKCPSVKWE